MLALDLEAAKKLAIVLMIGFILLSLAAAVVIKNVVMKLVGCLLMAGFALGVWTQRSSLETCADTVRAKVTTGDTSATVCTFFGSDVTIPEVTVG